MRKSWPGWVPTMAALLGLALTLYASYWQFGKAQAKAASQTEFVLRQGQALLNLNEFVPPVQTVQYRRVTATGSYKPDKSIYLDNRIRNGVAGYEVLVPMQLSSSGRFVLINRGWIARGRERTVLKELVTPANVVTVSGTATIPREIAFELSDVTIEGKIWQNVLMARYRTVQQIDILDFVIHEESDENDGLIRQAFAPSFGIEKNQSYGVQWLFFASLILFFYIYYGFVRTNPQTRK